MSTQPTLRVFCSRCHRAVDKFEIRANYLTGEQTVAVSCHGAEETKIFADGIPPINYFFKPVMKKICITGEAVVRFTHTMEVREDEAAEILADRENLITAIDTSEENMQIVEWSWIKGAETK